MPPRKNKGSSKNVNKKGDYQKEYSPKKSDNQTGEGSKTNLDDEQNFPSAQEEEKQTEDQQTNNESTQPENTETTQENSQLAESSTAYEDHHTTQEKANALSALNNNNESEENDGEEPNPFQEKNQEHTQDIHQNEGTLQASNDISEGVNQQESSANVESNEQQNQVGDESSQPSAVEQQNEPQDQPQSNTQEQEQEDKSNHQENVQQSVPATEQEREELINHDFGTVESSNPHKHSQATVVVDEPGLTIMKPTNLEESVGGTVVVNDQGPRILDTNVQATNKQEQEIDPLAVSTQSEWHTVESKSKNDLGDHPAQEDQQEAHVPKIQEYLLENKFEALEPTQEEKKKSSQAPDLTSSHVVIDNDARTGADVNASHNTNLHGSMQKNWEVVNSRRSEDLTAKEKAYEQEEDMRSDKANDNAASTRLMDDQEIHGQASNKEATSANTLSTGNEQTELSYEHKLARAEEDLRNGRALKEQGRLDEAVNAFQAAKRQLNPDHFQNPSQAVLKEVSQKLVDCALETADSYDQLNDFNQSISFAKVVLRSDPNNLRALYLLGIGLVRIGDLDEAHATLKKTKTVKASPEDAEYLNIVDKEIEKLDQIAESKALMKRSSSAPPEEQPLVVHEPGSIDEVPEVKREHQHLHKNNDSQKKKKEEGTSGAEYFLGSLVSSSALSFVVAKYFFKLPTRQGVVASLLVGAIVGGVSLVTQNAFKKDKKGK